MGHHSLVIRIVDYLSLQLYKTNPVFTGNAAIMLEENVKYWLIHLLDHHRNIDPANAGTIAKSVCASVETMFVHMVRFLSKMDDAETLDCDGMSFDDADSVFDLFSSTCSFLINAAKLDQEKDTRGVVVIADHEYHYNPEGRSHADPVLWLQVYRDIALKFTNDRGFVDGYVNNVDGRFFMHYLRLTQRERNVAIREALKDIPSDPLLSLTDRSYPRMHVHSSALASFFLALYRKKMDMHEFICNCIMMDTATHMVSVVDEDTLESNMRELFTNTDTN